jgi:hypothetical protein
VGFFYWGERNAPERRGTEWREVDPRKVRWHHNDLNERAVKHYEQHPDQPYDGQSGDPYVVVDQRGRMHGRNGRHRAEAAARQGRRLRVRVRDERQG